MILKKFNMIEEGKKIGTGRVIKHNEIINNSLKSEIYKNVTLLFKVSNKRIQKV